ncbi:MAG TPA: LptA/OstA family protein [Polyangiaceae bacterium]|nr:LptA/OstA family protein [Polyangiaceae bacterium]
MEVFNPAAIRRFAWIGIAACSLGLGAHSAQAGTLAVVAGETLDIKADSLEVDMARGSALLEGKVKATLGELQVECARVEVRYDEAPNVRWARGTGGVSARLKGIAATANTVEVDVARRSVRLEGAVKLSRGKGWVTADTATIDVATRKVVLNDVQGSIPVQTPAR